MSIKGKRVLPGFVRCPGKRLARDDAGDGDLRARDTGSGGIFDKAEDFGRRGL